MGVAGGGWRSVPRPVLEKQMRQSDVATTLRIYTQAIPNPARRNAGNEYERANR